MDADHNETCQVFGKVKSPILLWREPLDWARVAGIVLIISGILIINLFSKVTVH